MIVLPVHYFSLFSRRYQTSQPYFHTPETTEYHQLNNVSYNMDSVRQEQDMAELTVHQEPAEYNFSVPQQPVPQNTATGTTN